MPWWKDYPKVLGLMMLVAGVILIYIGQKEIGIPLIAAATGVGLARTGPKKMVLLLFLLPLFCGSCVNPEIPESVQELNRAVYARHDAYVEHDTGLSDLEKRTYLRSTEILRGWLDEAGGDGSVIIIGEGDTDK